MQDFDSVNASSTDPSALVEQLTEKSKEGWDVLAIVPTGGNITAFLVKPAAGKATEEKVERKDPVGGTAPAGNAPGAAGAVSEPPGWGSAPGASTGAAATVSPGASVSPAAASATTAPTSPVSTPAATGAPSFQPANVTPSVVAPAQAPAQNTPAVPSGWYADPAGRFELRYWDGKTWTEHVSRGGQQATDPPTR